MTFLADKISCYFAHMFDFNDLFKLLTINTKQLIEQSNKMKQAMEFNCILGFVVIKYCNTYSKNMV